MKTPRQLSNLFYFSVGRGANLLLNVPPNRDGLIDAADAASLKAYGEYLRQTFDKPVGTGGAERPGEGSNCSDLPADTSFDVIKIAENIRFGQRIESVMVEMMDGDSWKPLTSATSIGPRRIIRLPALVSSPKVRMIVALSAAAPLVSEFSLYRQAPIL